MSAATTINATGTTAPHIGSAVSEPYFHHALASIGLGARMLLAPDELVSVLDVLGHPTTTDTLKRWRMRGEGPTSKHVGKRVRYHVKDVVAWLDTA